MAVGTMPASANIAITSLRASGLSCRSRIYSLFNGSQLEFCENNIGTGSIYLCCTVFLPLGLNADDVFWSAPYEEWSSLKAWSGHQIETDQPINF